MRTLFYRCRVGLTQSPLGVALVLASLTFALVPAALGLKTRLLAGWTVGVGYFLLRSLTGMRTATPAQTRDRSQRHSTGGIPTLTLVVTVLLICISAIGFLVSTDKQMSPPIQMLHVGLAALAIFSAWCLAHITFAQQYAALYYHPTLEEGDRPWAGGIAFQKEAFPNYWDFLYFSFVIGATAQTSDTFILSRPIRRLALVQGLVAFLFFVGILGMCVNVGSALLQSGHG